jgi:tetratricopeptide (TPR) repeat protein
LPYAGLASIYMDVAGMEGNRALTEKAKVAATRAIALDSELPEAHLAQGQVLMRGEWDWTGASREFDRALTLAPNLGNAHWAKSTLLMALGQNQKALEEMKTAQRLDPASQDSMDDLGWAYDCNRNWDAAIRSSKAAVAMDPQSITANHQLGKAFLHAKQYAEARKALEITLHLDLTQRGLADLGQLSAQMGDVTRARAILAELTQANRQKATYEFAYMKAVLEASLGDKDAAFRSLELATAQKLSRAIWMRVDPDLDPLRNDPRLGAMLRRVRLMQ